MELKYAAHIESTRKEQRNRAGERETESKIETKKATTPNLTRKRAQKKNVTQPTKHEEFHKMLFILAITHFRCEEAHQAL